MYEITVSKVFSAAHAIRLSDGSREPLHGHNWHVEVTVGREELDAIDVVMDFHELEAIVDSLVKQVDNQNLNEADPFADGKINPTAERVAWWLGTVVARQLPDRVTLSHVTVTEAPGCRAIYRPPDYRRLGERRTQIDS